MSYDGDIQSHRSCMQEVITDAKMLGRVVITHHRLTPVRYHVLEITLRVELKETAPLVKIHR